MHNHDGKSASWMMWVMIICCALPLVFIVLLGAGGKALEVSSWVTIVGIGLMLLVHFFMMGRSHTHSDGDHKTTDEEGKNEDTKNNKDHSDHKCCH